MAKEIDHRVMNSLQFVSGLLAMQSRSPDVGEAAAHLELAAHRVAAVAQVHRHVYADAAEEVSCVAYLRRLCGDLAAIARYPSEGIAKNTPALVSKSPERFNPRQCTCARRFPCAAGPRVLPPRSPGGAASFHDRPAVSRRPRIGFATEHLFGAGKLAVGHARQVIDPLAAAIAVSFDNAAGEGLDWSGPRGGRGLIPARGRGLAEKR